ncbi:MAG: hypothetical protein J3Q66DRAFT_332745 [Benniella sp.]|nr:MAG: hypothetical protein J3Q66DRAFT_332745 [Benniella sp.]
MGASRASSARLPASSSGSAAIPTIIAPADIAAHMDGQPSSSTRIPSSHSTSSFYSIDLSTVPSTPTLSSETSQSMRSSLMNSPISPCWLPERTMRYSERPKDEKPVERVLFPSSEAYDCMVSELAVASIVPFAIHNSVNHEHGMKDHEGSMQSLDPRFKAHKKLL